MGAGSGWPASPHQNEESAVLLIKAISWDMRGAQASIPVNRDWTRRCPADADLDMIEQVATIFARYPYPESTDPQTLTVMRRDRLGGVLHEYERAA